ncbi:MAG: hypothetical protein HUK08_05600, partial [Bacteroidaceae bacterium]|nr:hypothetical protein [Bacteroidaceae bacterium]
VFCYVTEWPDEENTPEAGTTMSVPVKNGEHLTNVYVNDEEVKFVFSAKTGVLVFYIPENATAQSVVKLVSDNGEIEYKNVAVKPAGEITTKLWTGPKALGWSGDGQVYMGTDGGPELISLGAKAGDILRIKFTPTASDWQAQIWEGHWGTMYDEIKADNYDLEANKNCYYITLTDELIQQFTTAQGWGGIVLCQGQSMTVDELALIQKISQEIELWKGCETLGWSAEGQIYLLQDGGQQLIDNGAKVGSKLRIKFNPTADDWQAQIWEGHWGTMFAEIKAENYDLAANDNCYDIEITADLLQTFTTPQGWGGVVLTQGQSMQVVKVSLVP